MKRFKQILCVVAPGEAYKPALDRAVSLAENNQASLTVVDVVERVTAGIDMPEGGPISADLQAALVSSHAQKLQAMVAPYLNRISIETRVLQGAPFLQIIRDVLANQRDLVIKVPENLDWLDRIFGSDDMHLLRKCPCPVWLIKPEAPKAYRRILAAVDLDDNCPPTELEARDRLNQQILQMASSQALTEFAELHVVHAWNAPGESVMRGGLINTPQEKISAYVNQIQQHFEQRMQALMSDAIAPLGKEVLAYLKPQTHLVKGWARKEIPALAKQIDADLIVMGTVARTGIPGFIMGNTAETILNQIDCSVLAIKPPGFVTPVTLAD